MTERTKAIEVSLPDRRPSHTIKFVIGGQTCYLTCGEYPDGSLGEIFLVCNKVGSALRSFTDAWAISVSKGLRHGIPLEEYVDAFLNYRFEPNGPVFCEGCGITESASILDFVARYLGITFLKRDDLAGTHRTKGGEL